MSQKWIPPAAWAGAQGRNIESAGVHIVSLGTLPSSVAVEEDPPCLSVPLLKGCPHREIHDPKRACRSPSCEEAMRKSCQKRKECKENVQLVFFSSSSLLFSLSSSLWNSLKTARCIQGDSWMKAQKKGLISSAQEMCRGHTNETKPKKHLGPLTPQSTTGDFADLSVGEH